MLEMFSVFSNPSMLHAAVVHLPIALLTLGIPLLLLAGVLHRNNTLRLVALLLYVTAAGTAWYGVETGEDANRHVPAEIPAEVSDIRDNHHDYAHLVLYAAAATAALILVSLVPLQEVRVLFMLLALVSAIGAAMLVAYTGHLGGQLVYEHGIGTPHMKTYTAPPAALAPAPDAAMPASPAAPGDAGAVPAPAPVPAPEPAADLVPIRPIDLAAAKQVSYTRDIVPIMEEYCIDCHENPDADGNYDVTTVANLLAAGDKAGPGVIPGDPDNSSIVKYIRGQLKPRMPKKEDALSEETLHTIRLWIAAGAIDDSAAAAPAESTPAPSELAPVPAPEVTPLAAPAAAMPNTAPVNTETPATPTP